MTPVPQLPATLPIFPLPGAILLPRHRLPLNIFEPRYLAMVEDALGQGRLLGMIQPSGANTLCRIGCAGRIVSFAETEDGRMLLMLEGVSRFAIASEIATMRGYRRVQPDWSDFAADIAATEEPLPRELRCALLDAIKPYFKRHGIVASWDTLEEATPERLVATLAQTCPFESREKQALLEAKTLEDRSQLLLTLLLMASHERQLTDHVCH